MTAGHQGVIIEHTGIPGTVPEPITSPGILAVDIETVTAGTEKCTGAAADALLADLFPDGVFEHFL